MALTVRVDSSVCARLDRVAAQRGTTRSDVVREALTRFVQQEEGARGSSFFDEISHVIGAVDSGGQALSTQTGVRFRKLLEARRARDSG